MGTGLDRAAFIANPLCSMNMVVTLGSFLTGQRAGRLAMLLLVMIAAGCAETPRAGHEETFHNETPHLPRFLTGPAGVWLTNVNGFSARVTIETSAGSEGFRSVSGQLLGRERKLLFAPDSGKRGPGGGLSYIWDVANHTGYILSEPLQGYAPASAETWVTNFAVKAGSDSGASERIDGHACVRAEATASLSDGTSSETSAWRAGDLANAALRVQSTGGNVSFTVNCTEVRLEAPPMKLFLPPEGFTAYTNAEAMSAEALLRATDGRKRQRFAPPEEKPMEPRRSNRYGQP